MPVEFNIAIADKTVGITTFYDSTYNMCRNYLTDLPCDFSVTITEADIRHEREINPAEAGQAGTDPAEYPDSYLETLAVYRKIATEMLEYDTLLFHGSAIAVDGEAYLFAAKSGTGKSTHARLWKEHFGERAVMINDDKPFLRITDDGVFVCGTPWDGKHRLSSNVSVPLKAIAVLERDSFNHIVGIDRRAALPMLCQQSFRPKDAEKLAKAMDLISRLGNSVALYRLGCNMHPDAVTVSYNGMNERGTES